MGSFNSMSKKYTSYARRGTIYNFGSKSDQCFMRLLKLPRGKQIVYALSYGMSFSEVRSKVNG